MKQNAATTGLRAALFVPLIACGLLLSACGAGSGIDGYKPAPQATSALPDFDISTRSVPMGHVDASYPTTQLDATGASGPVAWSLTDGDLPAGMALSSGGSLSGTPTETGLFPITVCARDGAAEDMQALLLSVDTFGVLATDGLHFGDAWTGDAVTLTSAGASGPVDYEIVNDETGGYLNGGTFIPGIAGGTDAIATIRATDRNSGAYADIELTVQPHPAGGFVPRFGATDVWFLDFDLKRGAHGYATDAHATWAAVGLRGRTSYGTLGNEADQLADFLIRREVHKHINTFYLRAEDGTAGPEGLGISFAMERPDPSYAAPAAGGMLPGSTTNYSVISVCNAVDRVHILGAAVIDNSANPNHVNNSVGSSLGELGVFLNGITSMAVGAYRLNERSLLNDPVSADDAETLRALLHGADAEQLGPRAEDIAYTVWGISRSIAAVAAHEIAHSCGVHHNATTTAGALMNYASTIHPQARYAFLPANLAQLRDALPGPGRYGSARRTKLGTSETLAAQATFFGGGVCICDQR